MNKIMKVLMSATAFISVQQIISMSPARGLRVTPKAPTPQAIHEIATAMGATRQRPKSIPVGQAQTKAQQAAGIASQAEQMTAELFGETKKASPKTPPLKKQKSIGELPSWQTPLEDAYNATFGQIPGGRDWQGAFARINTQTWNHAITQAASSLKPAEAAKIKQFNTKLTTFMKQGKSPMEVDTISNDIGNYLRTPGLSDSAKQIAQTIKNAADALTARINR